MKLAGIQLVSPAVRRAPDAGQGGPQEGTITKPRFLNGESPAPLGDGTARKALADAIFVKRPWFAAAYVNRIWGELMGQSFYQPVDDLGPQKEAVFPTVLPRWRGGVPRRQTTT